jgi:acyl-CoA synthetase (AMP-forming)/AMP-acid ligase II
MTAAVDLQALAAEVVARLTGPGGEFEVVEQDVLGTSMPVFANRSRSLGAVLAATNAPADRDYIVTAERRLTYAEHAAAVASLAAELQRRYGVGKGDRVAILAANSPEWIVAFWATVSLGAVAVGYNAWWTTPEVAYALGHSAPKVLIADAKRAARLPDTDVPVLTMEDDLLELMRADPAALPATTEVDEDDPAAIVYTSGTTGRPKGATHSHRNMIATLDYHRMMNAMAAAFRPDGVMPPGRWLLSMPLFHIASLHNLAVPRLATAETVVMTQGAFDARRVLGLVASEGVTNWTVVPTMAHRLVELGDVSGYDLSALRAFSLASAPSSTALQTKLRELIPIARDGLVDSYGLTESCTGATVAIPPVLAANPGTVGYPIPLVRVQIRDAGGAVVSDSRDAVSDDAEGEIWLRSPYNMLGYWDDPAATAASFDGDRWMRTGDIGCLRERRLYLTTRRSDLILRGGENVYPVEIEQCLDEHPAVEECAVIGVDHPDLGQEVGAIVVLTSGASATQEELAAYVGERLAYYKVPSRWRISGDRLPRNATGKVIRHDLHA